MLEHIERSIIRRIATVGKPCYPRVKRDCPWMLALAIDLKLVSLTKELSMFIQDMEIDARRVHPTPRPPTLETRLTSA
jgi:hypothetical protein